MDTEGEEDQGVTSLGGPVEDLDGQLMLRIPLVAGGEALIECARGISRLNGGYLEIRIQSWLAEKLGIFEGSRVVVDNRNGKFNITLGSEPAN
jgi:hypothetical protein